MHSDSKKRRSFLALLFAAGDLRRYMPGEVMKFIFALLLLFPCLTFAGGSTYSCEVKAEFSLADDGILKLENKSYIGSQFNVERKSGLVMGDVIGNSAYPTKQVIDVGSSEQSYQLVWISHEVWGVKGAFNSAYLRIQEYHAGIEKPFILNLGYKTLSGLCK